MRHTAHGMSSHGIQHLVHQYGLGLVFIVVGLQALGVPLPGTTALAAAAVYAATSHSLSIVGVIAAGALGALAGTTAGYALGHWRGEPVLLAVGRRLGQSPARVQLVRGELTARGGWWLIPARFITGGRNLAGVAAGASGMPLGRFVALSAVAALLWAVVAGCEYYWFGRAITGADTWVQIVLVAAGVAWLLLSLGAARRRALRRLRNATSTES